MRRLLSFVVAAIVGAAVLLVNVPAEAQQFRIGAHRALMGSFEVVADRMGYFKEAGLDYTLTYFKQGKLMRNAVIQDNLDVGTTGFSPFVTAISKGAKVTGIAVTANICGTQYIMVPVDSQAQSVKDLKGTTFAVSKGTSVDFAFKSYVLPKHGMQESDLKWLNVLATERVAALLAGTAQAAIIGDPQAEIALQKGLVRKLEDFCPYDKTRMMHIGNPRTLQEHPEFYEKYFTAWLRAHKLLQDDPETYARVYTEALQEVGDKAEYDVILPVIKRLRSEPALDEEVHSYLQDMAKKQQDLGWISQAPSFDQGEALDDSLYRKAAAGLTN